MSAIDDAGDVPMTMNETGLLSYEFPFLCPDAGWTQL